MRIELSLLKLNTTSIKFPAELKRQPTDPNIVDSFDSWSKRKKLRGACFNKISSWEPNHWITSGLNTRFDENNFPRTFFFDPLNWIFSFSSSLSPAREEFLKNFSVTLNQHSRLINFFSAKIYSAGAFLPLGNMIHHRKIYDGSFSPAENFLPLNRFWDCDLC